MSARDRSGPRVAVVVLAAGTSRRMGNANKLLLPVGGVPMVRRVAAAAVASQAAPVVVVTGYQAAQVVGALDGLAVKVVENPDFAAGQSTSLRRGLQSVPGEVAGAVIMLADMPWVTAAHLDRLIAAHDPDAHRLVCVPTWRGRRGNPVLWPRAWFPELARLRGDRGARDLLAAGPAGLHEVAMDDDAIHRDVDGPGDLGDEGSPAPGT